MHQKMEQIKKLQVLNKNYKINFETIASVLLYCWCFLPLISAMGYSLAYITKQINGLDISIRYSYSDTMMWFGILSLFLCSFFLIDCILHRKGCIWQKIKEKTWNILLLGMLFWSVISTIRSDNPLYSFWGSSYRFDGLQSYFYYAAVMGLGCMIKSAEKKKRIIGIFASVANLIALIMMFQEWQIPVVSDIFTHPRSAVFYQENHLGYYLCMSILCLAGLYIYEACMGYRIYFLISLVWQIYVLIVNYTFGCYLAVIVGSIGLILFSARRHAALSVRNFVPLIVIIILTIISCLGGIPTSAEGTLWDRWGIFFKDIFNVARKSDKASSAGTGRWKLWITALEMIPERPIFGYGPEMLYGEYWQKVRTDRPHNEYIQHAVFLGIPALIMYLSALISLVVSQWKKLPKLQISTVIAAGVVVAYLFSALFGNTMFYTTPYFFMFLGFASSQEEGQPEKRVG